MDQANALSVPIDPVRRLPEKATPGKAVGVRAVCTNAHPLWKGPEQVIFRFCDRRKSTKTAAKQRACLNFRKSQPHRQEKLKIGVGIRVTETCDSWW
jgi:hypothetical protein